jgi:hypothetical protein
MMAGRKNDLTTLGERVQVDPMPPEETADTAGILPDPPAAPRKRATQPRRRPHPPAPGQGVRYDELERKEARLRIDQYGRLSELSRSLNRRRAGRGERITENTLIRVAIDLLLSREHDLNGDTEIELRKSVDL